MEQLDAGRRFGGRPFWGPGRKLLGLLDVGPHELFVACGGVAVVGMGGNFSGEDVGADQGHAGAHTPDRRGAITGVAQENYPVPYISSPIHTVRTTAFMSSTTKDASSPATTSGCCPTQRSATCTRQGRVRSRSTSTASGSDAPWDGDGIPGALRRVRTSRCPLRAALHDGQRRNLRVAGPGTRQCQQLLDQLRHVYGHSVAAPAGIVDVSGAWSARCPAAGDLSMAIANIDREHEQLSRSWRRTARGDLYAGAAVTPRSSNDP